MATPLTPTQMLSALHKAGLTVVEYKDWRTHNRNHKGPWGPVHGIVIHHTVTHGDTPEQTMSSVALCYNGHADLPGPLCHAVGAKNGTVYLVGHGRTNHAGLGDPDVARAVEREAAHLPADNQATEDGNKQFYGIELINRGDGKDPWPSRQYDAAVRWAAGIAHAHGWSERSVIGHKEWQPGKVDPTFSMDQFRADVRTELIKLAAPPAKPSVPSAPASTGGTMQYTSLARSEDVTIPDGESREIYWTAEYQDGSGDHGTAGKTVVSGDHYTGTVSLTFTDGLPIGVSLRGWQQLDAGGESGEPVTALVAGVDEHSVSVTGRVPEDRNLVFKIHNDSAAPVTLAWAGIRLGTWPL